MRISNNIMALNTHRQYAINNSNVAKSTEKLSSGYRINRAGDDAAGLAISEKMRAQIRGLNMASKNSQDAISLVQTAEGALTETHSILQRMRELAVQSASDTNDSQIVDRDALNEEFQALKAEINDIANKTAFNGKKLLNGDFTSASTSVTNIESNVSVTAGSGATAGTTTLSIGSFTAATAATAGSTGSFTTDTVVSALAQNAAPTVTGASTNGAYTLRATANGAANVDYSLVDASGNTVATITDQTVAAGATTLNFGNYGSYDMTLAAGADQAGVVGELDASSSVGFSITGAADATPLSFEIGSATFSAASTSGEVATGITVDLSGINWSGLTDQASVEAAIFGSGNNSGDVTVVEGKGLVIQTGANSSDELSITIDDMSSSALKIDTFTADAIAAVTAQGKNVSIVAGAAVDLKSQESASVAIQSIDTAINTVSTQRSKLGAYQNRLEHKINNLDTSAENLQAAESRIRDLDMAAEMTAFTQNNILVQAATSMLAQANSAPQGVLKLLG